MKQTQRKAKPMKGQKNKAVATIATTVTPPVDHVAKFAEDAAILTRWLGEEVAAYTKRVSEDKVRPAFPRVVQYRLFEVRFNPELLKNRRVYTWLYENKRLVNTVGDGLAIAYFEDKEEGKMFRDILNQEAPNLHHHISYGPDHRRVVGEVA